MRADVVVSNQDLTPCLLKRKPKWYCYQRFAKKGKQIPALTDKERHTVRLRLNVLQWKLRSMYPSHKETLV
jgi:hypothetical protein